MRKSFIYSILGIFASVWLAIVVNLYINGTDQILGDRIYGLEAVFAWNWAYLMAIIILASIFAIAIGIAERLRGKQSNDPVVKLARRIVLILLLSFSAILGLSGFIR